MTGFPYEALVSAGLSPAEADSKARLLRRTVAALDARGPVGRPTRLYFVPGRIEVLGKHTDYAGGRSLLCAAERGFALAVRPRDDDTVTLTDVVHDTDGTYRLAGDQPARAHWHNYPSAVARRIARNFTPPLAGVDIALGSDLPRAAGMSSSTAFVIAVFLAIADRNDLPARMAWRDAITCPEDLASYLGSVENGASFGVLAGDSGVGTRGGSQDHTAILCSAAGHLVGYRFAPVAREALVPLEGRTFVVAASGVTASKAGEEMARYNRSVATLQALLAIWRARTRDEVDSLGALLEADRSTVGRLRAYIDEDADGGFSRELLHRRLDQFVLEALEVVPAATQALAAGDWDTFGRLVDASQRAAETCLENQTPETTALAARARSLGADAASAFGAGFGGSVWALVPAGDAAPFADAWSLAYLAEFPHLAGRAQFFATRPGPPVLRL